MLVSNLLNATMTRLDFGPNLLNNNPTGTNLGNPGFLLNLPRGNSYLTDCDQQLISYTLNEGGALNRYNYQGNVTNAPSAANVNTYPYGSIYNSLLPFTYNGVLYYLCPHTSGTIYRMPALTYPPQTVTNYYNPNFSYTFSTPGTYNITLHCDQGFSQGPSAYCKQVVVVSSMAGISLGNDTTICGNAYTLSTNVVGNGTYQWSTGATTPTITVTTSGTYWVNVNGACNSGSDTINVTIQPQPVVNLGPDVVICAGQSTTLQSQGTFTGPAYLWNTGSTNPSINVSQAGIYWLQVSQGICTDVDSIQVTVQNPPSVSLGNDTAICAASYTLTPSVQNGTSYLWSTGATTASITVTNSGTYWVNVAGSGNCGNDLDTINITLQQPFTFDLGPDTFLCTGQSVTLQPQGTFSGPAYLWSTGSTNSTITVNQSGLYSLLVTQGICTASDTVNVTVQNPPIVDLGNDKIICPGESLVLQSSNSYTNPTYTWNTGDASSSITISQPGTYWLSVSVATGCDGVDTINIAQGIAPVVTINDTSICPGNSTSIQAQGNFTNPGYLWSNGNVTASTTVSQSGTYWVIVNDNGCNGSDTMILTYLPEPLVDIHATDSLCPGTTIPLSSIQPDGSQYLWSNGSTGSTINAGTGEHWLIVTNTFGCKAGDTTNIFEATMPAVALGNDTSICNGNIVTLSPLYYSGSLEWNNNSTADAINVSEDGIYYITATNSCGTATDSLYVHIEDCNIWVPDAFTPNGDGKNDIFRVKGNFTLATDFTFSIYDRWGERIFVTEDPIKGWDGTFRGNLQDVNTFAYMLKCKMGGKSVLLKGFFHLIR